MTRVRKSRVWYERAVRRRDIASADTHPKGGDSVQHEAPSPMSGAVPEGQTPTKGFPHG
jgi:hypothetical protein